MDAIVLARKDYKEFDQIITVLTREEGRKDLISRSVKKITSKNAAHLEPCCFVSIDITHGKEMNILVRAINKNIFKEIRSDMHKSYVAQYLAILVYKISKQEDVNKNLFNSLLGCLELIDQSVKPFNLLNICMLQILDAIGFKPELSNCITCNKNINNLDLNIEFVFIIESGGICCKTCIKQNNKVNGEAREGTLGYIYNITNNIKKIFSNINNQEFDILEKYTNKDLEEFHQIILNYARYYLDIKIPDWIN